LAEQLIDQGRFAMVDVGNDRHVAQLHDARVSKSERMRMALKGRRRPLAKMMRRSKSAAGKNRQGRAIRAGGAATAVHLVIFAVAGLRAWLTLDRGADYVSGMRGSGAG